jgi:integrase
MSVYFVRGKGWRYDFTLKGTRYTEAWFETKKEAQRAQNKRKEDLLNEKAQKESPTDMAFFDLANRRLDFLRAYCSEKHYKDTLYYVRRWVKQWDGLSCGEISKGSIESYLVRRKRQASAYTSNKELRLLRALYNFALERQWAVDNLTKGIRFMPEAKKENYVPAKEDVLKVILAARPDTHDYLWTVALTIGRISEINQLKWEDVSFKERYVVLWTRKKRGGHCKARKIPMPNKLYDILLRQFQKRNKRVPWVFWHRYWSRKERNWVVGPYQYRGTVMKSLCKKAGVKYFSYHPLRHFGASLLDRANRPVGEIQRILGHENRKTTELYLHSLGESEREAMGVFDEEFGENSHTDSHTERKKDSSELA